MTDENWSWQEFWVHFWGAFGRAMAVAVVVLVIAAFVADTQYANFFSAVTGITFAAILSAIYGYSEGEEAVRRWREQKEDL